MKPIQALIVAVFLGIITALFNYAYLNFRAKPIAKVDFIGVKPNETINRGERLLESKLARVSIPSNNVGNLDKFAIRWEDIETVKGVNVWRKLSDTALLMRSDLRTPPQELQQGIDATIWVPVNPRTFVPSLLAPGDKVSFLLPPVGLSQPTPAGTERPGAVDPTAPIGPFTIQSIGNRLGTTEIMKASGQQAMQENVIGINVEYHSGKIDPRVRELKRAESSSVGLGVLLHNREKMRKMELDEKRQDTRKTR